MEWQRKGIRLSRDNLLWGAPKIHGELLKLGIEISESPVSKYLVRGKGSPSQSWRTFLGNHPQEMVSADFFTVRQFASRSFTSSWSWHTNAAVSCTLPLPLSRRPTGPLSNF
jgi:hypothetical protein